MGESVGQLNIDLFINTIFKLLDDKNNTITKVKIKKVGLAESTKNN